MAKVKVYDMSAKVVGEIELDDELFALPYNCLLYTSDAADEG